MYSSCQDTDSCVNGFGITLLPSSAGSIANLVSFTLSENKKHNTTVHVQYNGGVVQQSQPVEISECMFVTDILVLTTIGLGVCTVCPLVFHFN